MAANWKQIAWNGICFKIPDSWEIGRIGARHLILEDGSEPALEIKWGSVKGKFSHSAHLKRLGALQTGRVKKTFKEWILPPEWDQALTDFHTVGFAWQAETKAGRGVILYCPSCRNATLIQFFQPKSDGAEKIFPEVLRAFQDHREDGLVDWSVFDIRAVMPANFKLVQHRFEAGKYRLTFAHGAQKICLYRWAPASVLLEARNLRQFGETITDFCAGDPAPIVIGGLQMLEWNSSPRFKRLSRFKPKPSFHGLRLWHLEENNRILGVKVQGKRAFDTPLLNRICAGYESL